MGYKVPNRLSRIRWRRHRADVADEVCDSLVGEVGRTYDEYERWLRATLADALLKRGRGIGSETEAVANPVQ